VLVDPVVAPVVAPVVEPVVAGAVSPLARAYIEVGLRNPMNVSKKKNNAKLKTHLECRERLLSSRIDSENHATSSAVLSLSAVEP